MMRIARCAALAAAGALLGCDGPDLRAQCESFRDCEGGNEKDVEACVVWGEYFQEAASTLGCDEEFELFVECYHEKATCEDVAFGSCATTADCGSDPTATCAAGTCTRKRYTLDDDDCEPEGRAWHRCQDMN